MSGHSQILADRIEHGIIVIRIQRSNDGHYLLLPLALLPFFAFSLGLGFSTGLVGRVGGLWE